jgi:hypothetical protein
MGGNPGGAGWGGGQKEVIGRQFIIIFQWILFGCVPAIRYRPPGFLTLLLLDNHELSPPAPLPITGFYPRILRVEAPVKYQQVAGGAMRVEADPGSIKLFDRGLGRVWLHPASVCFRAGSYSSGEWVFVCVGGGVAESDSLLGRKGQFCQLEGPVWLRGSGRDV